MVKDPIIYKVLYHKAVQDFRPHISPAIPPTSPTYHLSCPPRRRLWRRGRFLISPGWELGDDFRGRPLPRLVGEGMGHCNQLRERSVGEHPMSYKVL